MSSFGLNILERGAGRKNYRVHMERESNLGISATELNLSNC